MQRVCTLENEFDRCFIFVHIIILQLWKVFCHTRGTLMNPHIYVIYIQYFTMLYIHWNVYQSFYVIYKRQKNLIPSTCKIVQWPYSESLYFLISTLFSVKFKKTNKIYIYLKVYYFIMRKKYIFILRKPRLCAKPPQGCCAACCCRELWGLAL